MAINVRQYWDLTKPKVVALIVFTALVGMFLAIPALPTAEQALRGALGFLGIWPRRPTRKGEAGAERSWCPPLAGTTTRQIGRASCRERV